MDRGAWQATVQRVAESDMTEELSTHACTQVKGIVIQKTGHRYQPQAQGFPEHLETTCSKFRGSYTALRLDNLLQCLTELRKVLYL